MKSHLLRMVQFKPWTTVVPPLQPFIFLRPCDDSHMHLTAPCSTRALSQTRPTMSCILLIVVPAGLQLISVDLFVIPLNILLKLSKYSCTSMKTNAFGICICGEREAVAMEIVVKVNQQADVSSSLVYIAWGLLNISSLHKMNICHTVFTINGRCICSK